MNYPVYTYVYLSPSVGCLWWWIEWPCVFKPIGGMLLMMNRMAVRFGVDELRKCACPIFSIFPDPNHVWFGSRGQISPVWTGSQFRPFSILSSQRSDCITQFIACAGAGWGWAGFTTPCQNIGWCPLVQRAKWMLSTRSRALPCPPLPVHKVQLGVHCSRPGSQLGSLYLSKKDKVLEIYR